MERTKTAVVETALQAAIAWYHRSPVLATAQELDATAYDAVYLTLAQALGTPLLTAERKTTPWVVRLGRLVETVAR